MYGDNFSGCTTPELVELMEPVAAIPPRHDAVESVDPETKRDVSRSPVSPTTVSGGQEEDGLPRYEMERPGHHAEGEGNYADKSERAPYVAAGVLPFCMLGGDMLFLLGQQLRFTKKRNGSPSRHGNREQRGAAEGDRSIHGSQIVAPIAPSLSADARCQRRCRPCPTESSISDTRMPLFPSTVPSKDSPETASCQRKCTSSSSNINGFTKVNPMESTHAKEDSDTRRIEDSEAMQRGAGEEPAVGSGDLSLCGRSGTANVVCSSSDEPEGVVGSDRRSVCSEDEVIDETMPSSADVSRWPGREDDQDCVPAGLLWSDFGGCKESVDLDAESTASREFAEESLGMFNSIRLEPTNVARSQATMESMLRDRTLRGKRVFECRNGGYVMFVAAVDFVPDIMMKLARKEIMGAEGSSGCAREGFTEKTDFAWVPASSLLRALRESRHRSTKRVVVKLGGCRYLRLFHKFVISLWDLDLSAVIKAASSPTIRRHHLHAVPSPRALLLRAPGRPGKDAVKSNRRHQTGCLATVHDAGVGTHMCAIRGIDCIRPSFLSGRKRTGLGIIDGRNVNHSWSRPRLQPDAHSPYSKATARERSRNADRSHVNLSACTLTVETHDHDWDTNGCLSATSTIESSAGIAAVGRRTRRGKSGAACRKKRRQLKEARRTRSAAVLATNAAANLHGQQKV